MSEPSLTEFLLARIAEDEAQYDAAAEAEAESCRNDGMPDMTAESVKDFWTTVQTRWPRYLAECEAKRRIVEKAQRADQAFRQSINPASSAASFALNEVLQFLALPYADHEDYDERWRP